MLGDKASYLSKYEYHPQRISFADYEDDQFMKSLLSLYSNPLLITQKRFHAFEYYISCLEDYLVNNPDDTYNTVKREMFAYYCNHKDSISLKLIDLETEIFLRKASSLTWKTLWSECQKLTRAQLEKFVRAFNVPIIKDVRKSLHLSFLLLYIIALHFQTNTQVAIHPDNPINEQSNALQANGIYDSWENFYIALGAYMEENHVYLKYCKNSSQSKYKTYICTKCSAKLTASQLTNGLIHITHFPQHQNSCSGDTPFLPSEYLDYKLLVFRFLRATSKISTQAFGLKIII